MTWQTATATVSCGTGQVISMPMNRPVPRRRVLAFLLLFAGLALTGCQTQKDAIAAAEQMASTVTTLRAYFGSLIQLVDSNEQAQSAQASLNGVPFDADTRAQLEDIRSELQKRREIAANFAKLSTEFAEIANSGATADAVKTAGDLNVELSNLHAYATSSAEIEAVKVVVTAIMNMLKAKQEVKAARLIKPAAQSLSAMFDAEAETYTSFANSFYITASSNSRLLIDRDQVAISSLYGSSLAPFGLQADIIDAGLKTSARDSLKQRVAARLVERENRNKVAADNLSASLHVMRDRIATVADHKALRVTLPPMTLEGVKNWIIDIKTDLGE